MTYRFYDTVICNKEKLISLVPPFIKKKKLKFYFKYTYIYSYLVQNILIINLKCTYIL